MKIINLISLKRVLIAIALAANVIPHASWGMQTRAASTTRTLYNRLAQQRLMQAGKLSKASISPQPSTLGQRVTQRSLSQSPFTQSQRNFSQQPKNFYQSSARIGMQRQGFSRAGAAAGLGLAAGAGSLAYAYPQQESELETNAPTSSARTPSLGIANSSSQKYIDQLTADIAELESMLAEAKQAAKIAETARDRTDIQARKFWIKGAEKTELQLAADDAQKEFNDAKEQVTEINDLLNKTKQDLVQAKYEQFKSGIDQEKAAALANREAIALAFQSSLSQINARIDAQRHSSDLQSLNNEIQSLSEQIKAAQQTIKSARRDLDNADKAQRKINIIGSTPEEALQSSTDLEEKKANMVAAQYRLENLEVTKKRAEGVKDLVRSQSAEIKSAEAQGRREAKRARKAEHLAKFRNRKNNPEESVGTTKD